MQELMAILTGTILPSLGTLATALVSWGAVEATRYVRKKTKNEAVNDAVAHVCHTVNTTVQSLEQSMVKEMKAAAADGKLTKAEAMDVKNQAYRTVMDQVPVATKELAAIAVTSLNRFVADKIEAAVQDLPRTLTCETISNE